MSEETNLYNEYLTGAISPVKKVLIGVLILLLLFFFILDVALGAVEIPL